MTEREQLANDMLQEIARDIGKKLPPKMGFCLLAYEFGDNSSDRKMLYVSNSNREDVATAMEEWIAKVKEGNYGKDID